MKKKPSVLVVTAEEKVFSEAASSLKGLSEVKSAIVKDAGQSPGLAYASGTDAVVLHCALRGDCAAAADAIINSIGIPVVYLSDTLESPSLKKALKKTPCPYAVRPLGPGSLFPPIEYSLAGAGSSFSKSMEILEETNEELRQTNDELTRIKMALEESEERFRKMVELAPWGILIHVNGILKYMNPAGLAIGGYSSLRELEGTPILDRIHPDDRQRVVERLAEQIRSNTRLDPIEERLICRNGEVRLCEVISLIYPEGNNTAVMAFFHDITDLGRDMDRLVKNESQYRVIYENAAEGIFSYNTAGNIIDVNRRTCDMLGYSPGELIGRNVVESGILHPGDVERASESMKKLLSGEPVKKNRYRLITKTGEELIADITGAAIRNAEGHIAMITSIIVDMTEQTKAILEFRSSEERYRTIFQNAAEAILVADSETRRFTRANPAACRWLGYTEEELRSMRVDDIHPRDEVRRVIEEFEQGTRAGSAAHDIPCLRKDGTVVHADIIISSMELDGRPATVGFFIDISRRKDGEKSLRQSEEKFRSVVEKSHMAIAIVNDRAEYVYVNERFCEMGGYSEEELIGRDFSFLLSEESKALALDRYVRRQRGEQVPDHYEFSFIRKNGNVRIGEVRSAVYTDSEGRVNSLIQVLDITERKKDEEIRHILETKIQQSQKLESLGILAGGIAHDFNNLLMAILGNIDLAVLDLPEDSAARATLLEAMKASNRAAELCRLMLAYSGKGRFSVETVELNHLIKDMELMLRVSIQKKALLEKRLGADTPPVRADATQIRQIIMNLVMNASDAIGDREGKITISTGKRYCDAAILAGSWLDDELPEGEYACIEVSDTGFGMDQDTLKKIFDPFFTTKFTGRGLGLAAVLGIVRAHRGAVSVKSERDRGTTFSILLPVHDGADTGNAAEDAPGETPAFSGTAIIVDDEDTVRDLGAKMLRKCGFTVLTAADGREALALFREKRDRVRCIILDLTMPHMDGEETLREIRLIDTAVPVIMTSGYTEHDVADRLRRLGAVGFIQKPYRYRELLHVLGAVLR